jgi:prepilin-type processing-associated H-X9-DG protein/prepilin-type N-terminal cleavage/methylation domain-containing protein
MKPASSSKAFTLIELLVTAGIIGVLAALLFPQIGRLQTQAKLNTCVSNVRQIGLACLQFAGDNDGRLPSSNGGGTGEKRWNTQLIEAGYLPEDLSKGAWRCPEVTGAQLAADGGGNASYATVGNWIICSSNESNALGGLGSLRVPQIPRPSTVWLVGDGGKSLGDGTYLPWGDIKLPKNGKWTKQMPAFRHGSRKKVNICFADGHVAAASEGEILDPKNNYLMQDLDGDGLGD